MSGRISHQRTQRDQSFSGTAEVLRQLRPLIAFAWVVESAISALSVISPSAVLRAAYSTD